MLGSLFWRRSSPESMAPPVVIGALGGSGTRAVSKIVRCGGWWLGSQVDENTEDSIAMRAFLLRWFEPLLDSPRLPANKRAAAERDFRRALGVHRQGMRHPSDPWGWKNPRNMWLLEFYFSMFPQLKFIHLVRDGRDMALSKNLFLLQRHGDQLLGPGWRDDPEAAQLAVWALGNRRAAELATACQPGNYLRLRYEDLCTSPVESVERVFAFLGTEAPPGPACAAVEPSAGIGRWQQAAADHAVHRPTADVRLALAEFGYLESDPMHRAA
jgi:hypothetical protein